MKRKRHLTPIDGIVEIVQLGIVLSGLALFRLRPRRIQIVERRSTPSPTLWVEVGRTYNSSRITGIERVTREISQSLGALPQTRPRRQIRFFQVNTFGKCSVVPEEWAEAPSGSQSPAKQSEHCRFSKGDQILLLNLSLPPRGLNLREIRSLRNLGVEIYALVYDVLPLSHPQLFPRKKPPIFRAWVKNTLELDGLAFISETTRRAWQAIVQDRPSTAAIRQTVIPLGGFRGKKGAQTSINTQRETYSRSCRLIAVGTIEPRKDYAGLLDALDSLWLQGFQVRVRIVGKPGWHCTRLVRRIVGHQRFGADLIWSAGASDEELVQYLAESDYLVANSVAEGFGLPLAEAAELGVAVVARDIDVFREVLPSAIFFPGGDPTALAETLRNLCEETRNGSPKYFSKCDERSWEDSALSVWNLLNEPRISSSSLVAAAKDRKIGK